MMNVNAFSWVCYALSVQVVVIIISILFCLHCTYAGRSVDTSEVKDQHRFRISRRWQLQVSAVGREVFAKACHFVEHTAFHHVDGSVGRRRYVGTVQGDTVHQVISDGESSVIVLTDGIIELVGRGCLVKYL